MNCNCGAKAVYNRRYSGQIFCKDCFNEYFERKVQETINSYKMIKRGESIGVGISGGKDSTVLLHVLRKISPSLKITLHPILVDEGIKSYRSFGLASADKTCSVLNLTNHVFSFKKEFAHTLDELLWNGKLKACTYCGILRRKILNQAAGELGLDKLAVGHNLDDEAQVILMNYLSGDMERLHRLAGKGENKLLVKRIKPLSRIPEKEIMLYAVLNKLDISMAECPYAKTNHRSLIRDFLNKLESKRPGVKFSVVRGWERMVQSSYVEGKELENCTVCGGPASQNVCRACELVEGIKIKIRDES
jgi:uncharacterized protein (TIGR00269 family)